MFASPEPTCPQPGYCASPSFAAYQMGGVSSNPTFVSGSPPRPLVASPARPYAESYDMCLAQFVAVALLCSESGISCCTLHGFLLQRLCTNQ